MPDELLDVGPANSPAWWNDRRIWTSTMDAYGHQPSHMDIIYVPYLDKKGFFTASPPLSALFDWLGGEAVLGHSDATLA